MTDVLMGVDVGSTRVKAVAVDVHDAELAVAGAATAEEHTAV